VPEEFSTAWIRIKKRKNTFVPAISGNENCRGMQLNKGSIGEYK